MNLGHETEKIEFKKSTSEAKSAMKSISAMLNKYGEGTIYFGVDPKGNIIGQEVSEKTLRDLGTMISNSIKPEIIPVITHERYDDKHYVKVEFESSDKPYSAYGIYYIRIADSDRELLPHQLKKVYFESIDTILEIPAINQELTFNSLMQRFIMKDFTINKNTFAKNFGLYTSKGKYNLMAELLSDQNSTSMKVVVFKGTDKSEMLQRNEFGYKCLIDAMFLVESNVESFNRTFVDLSGIYRKETKLFDFKCFKEAWENACIHNSWYLKVPPAVYIFSDRIEVVSNGGLRTDLSKEEFFNGKSRPINDRLQEILGQLELVEQTGHGVPLIVSKYGKKAFKITDNFMSVIIPFETTVKETEKNTDKILEYIKINGKTTTEDLVNHFKYSKSYIYKILSELQNNNHIVRIGSKKSGYWK